MKDRIRVVIADDHRLIREALRMVLSQEESIQIMGEAANGRETIETVGELKPDFVLLDIMMPEMNGIEVILSIREKSPKSKALMFTARMDEDTIFEALKAGARGAISRKMRAWLILSKQLRQFTRGSYG